MIDIGKDSRSLLNELANEVRMPGLNRDVKELDVFSFL